MAFAHGNFFLRFRPSISCKLRSFEWRVVLNERLLDLVTCVVRDRLNDFISWGLLTMTLQMILLEETESWSVWKSVRRIWLDETEIWSVWKSDRRIWLVGTEIWSIWKSDRRIWLVCPTCMSCQSNLIGRSDFLSSGNALWLANPMICLLAPSFDFFWLLVSQIHTVIHEQQETIRWRRLLYAMNTPFNLPLRAKQTKRPSPLLLLNLPVVEFKNFALC